jgi:hypothetical protein
MGEMTTSQAALYAVFIVVAMVVLDWTASRRFRLARARRAHLDRTTARRRRPA